MIDEGSDFPSMEMEKTKLNAMLVCSSTPVQVEGEAFETKISFCSAKGCVSRPLLRDTGDGSRLVGSYQPVKSHMTRRRLKGDWNHVVEVHVVQPELRAIMNGV